MTVKELIKKLRGFDENHSVVLEVDIIFNTAKCSIKDVKFENMTCVLCGETD